MQGPSQKVPPDFSLTKGISSKEQPKKDEPNGEQTGIHPAAVAETRNKDPELSDTHNKRTKGLTSEQRKKKFQFAVQQLDKHRGGATSTQREHERQVALWNQAMRDMQQITGPESTRPGPASDARLQLYAAWALTELELRDLDQVRGMLNKEAASHFNDGQRPWLNEITKETLRCYHLARQEFLDLSAKAREGKGMIEGKDFSFLEGVGQRKTAAAHRCLVPPTTLEWMLEKTKHSIKRYEDPSTARVSTAQLDEVTLSLTRQASIWLQFLICQRGCTLGGSNEYVSQQGLGADILFNKDGMQFTARFLKHWNPGIVATVAEKTPSACKKSLPITGPLIPWGKVGSARHTMMRSIQIAKAQNLFVPLDQGGQAKGADILTSYMVSEGIPAHAKGVLEDLAKRGTLPDELEVHYKDATFTSHSLRYSAVTLATGDIDEEHAIVAYVGWVRSSNLATYVTREVEVPSSLQGIFSFIPRPRPKRKRKQPVSTTESPVAEPKPAKASRARAKKNQSRK